MLLQCRITNYDSVGGDGSDYNGCNGCGDGVVTIIVIAVAAGAAAAAAYATTIRIKTSTHALDVNRIVKSTAVIATTDRIRYSKR